MKLFILQTFLYLSKVLKFDEFITSYTVIKTVVYALKNLQRCTLITTYSSLFTDSSESETSVSTVNVSTHVCISNVVYLEKLNLQHICQSLQ